MKMDNLRLPVYLVAYLGGKSFSNKTYIITNSDFLQRQANKNNDSLIFCNCDVFAFYLCDTPELARQIAARNHFVDKAGGSSIPAMPVKYAKTEDYHCRNSE